MLDRFLVVSLLIYAFAYADNPSAKECAPEDFDCYSALLRSNIYDGVCKNADDEFRCVIDLLPAQGLVGSKYFDAVYYEAADKAATCLNQESAAAFFETLALMKTTGYFLDGELSESLPSIVGDLCLNNMQCFENAFKSASASARDIIVQNLEYAPHYDDQHFMELTECKDKIGKLFNSEQIKES
ncbi:MAG: hypothetical protein LBC09_06815, partial [Helicobacteraceae bacterium]|nr:hypothetical protein [Helicobacteraceae bacterium]